MVLQGVGILGDFFIGPAQKEGELRNMNLLDLQVSSASGVVEIQDVFAMLPYKGTKPAKP